MEKVWNEILWDLIEYNAYIYVIVSDTLLVVSFEIL